MSTQITESDLTSKRAMRRKLQIDIFRLSEQIGLGATVDEILQELSTLQKRTAALLPDGQARTPQVVNSLNPGGADINIQQYWRHNDSGGIFRITNIQMGPVYRPGDTVTAWVPEKVFFRDITDTARNELSLVVYFWRQLMTELTTEEVNLIGTGGDVSNNDALSQEARV